jgi:hypothetical protein
MDLIAGDAREILLAISVDDWASLRDRSRFPAHVSFGGGMDPTWLDLFAQAAREAMGDRMPGPFSEAICRLETRQAAMSDRTVERVDSHWIDEIALLPESCLDRVAARWIDLIDREECAVEAEEKPMLRGLAGDLVDFCRRSQGAEEVLFCWSL